MVPFEQGKTTCWKSDKDDGRTSGGGTTGPRLDSKKTPSAPERVTGRGRGRPVVGETARRDSTDVTEASNGTGMEKQRTKWGGTIVYATVR